MYSHQAKAADLTWTRTKVVVATSLFFFFFFFFLKKTTTNKKKKRKIGVLLRCDFVTCLRLIRFWFRWFFLLLLDGSW
ncbi:hypothetical protein BT095_11810, partial [Corynebacterium diphtheriae]